VAFPARIGIVGCGDAAANIYVPNAAHFHEFALVACADIDTVRADEVAGVAGIDALSIEQLFARDDIDIVLNLTSPAAHYPISLAAIEAGKHVYTEKPLAISSVDAHALIAAAEANGVRTASSPDTFLGTSLTAARELVASGLLGQPISAEIVMQNSGPERFPHPRPQAFYAPGAGPLFDMGAYYLTPLIRLFGAVSTVVAMARTTYPTRTVIAGPDKGVSFEVLTPSHLAALLQFQSGLLATMTMSFDCAFWTHTFTLNGSNASLRLPDPDEHAGAVLLRRGDDPDWQEVAIDPTTDRNCRGLGLADFAEALRDERPHRASAAIAVHVVDVMNSVLHSAEAGTCTHVPPLELEAGLIAGDPPGIDAGAVESETAA
jgi:predicted dehydrogenase